MSIGLYLCYRDPRREDRLVPIASNHIFETHWLPLCLALRLRWVSRFQKGWALTSQDAAPILRELAHLRQHLTETMPEAEISHHLLARINVLMRELNDLQHHGDVDAFVGAACPPQQRAIAIIRMTPSRDTSRMRLPL